MSDINQKYFLALKNPNAKNSKAAFQSARKLGYLVQQRYGNQVIIIYGGAHLINELYDSKLFSFKTNKIVDTKELKSLNKDQQTIAQKWNFRFSKIYLNRQKELLKNVDKDTEIKDMPTSFSHIDPEEFIEKLKKNAVAKKLKLRKESVEELFKLRRINYKKGGRRSIVSYLKKKMGPRYTFTITGVIYAATFDRLKYFMQDEDWEPAIVETIGEIVVPEVCRELHGQISIGVVFVNSSFTNGPVINPADQNIIESDFTTEFDWLTTEHPSGNLSFVFDFNTVSIGVANLANSTAGSSNTFDSYWRDPGIGALGFTADRAGVNAYKNSLIAADGSDDAVVFFVTRYGSSWHAYSTGERFITLTEFNDNWNAYVPNLGRTIIHEFLHQFGAADEYDGDNFSCDGNCDDPFGCDNIPNGNCITCANPHRSCVMRYGYRKICQYTRGQVGWSDIFVELTTDDDTNSGTTNSVFLDIGHKVFELDVPGHRDRERTFKEGYAVFDTGMMDRNEIKRILIRKEDGSNGWKLKQVKVFHRGEVICDESPEVWLKDHEQFHLACDLGTGRQIVHKLALRVKTSNDTNAGTDGRVTLTLNNREWRINSNTNDFARGVDQLYNLDPMTGLRIADLTQLFISKSSTAVGGAWKLEGLELIVNDLTIYENNNINEWLDNNNLNYSEGISQVVVI